MRDSTTTAPAALWVGDSFTAGEGANVAAVETYPHLVGEQLGWRCSVDAQNGTGFVNDGWAASPTFGPLIQRLPDTARRHRADIVVVDAGRNDVEAPTPTVRQAVADYLGALAHAYPSAQVVLVAPSLPDRIQPPDYRRIAAILRRVAADHRARVIDPAREGAFRDPDRNRDLVCQDGFHPSAAGQAHYADVLASLLRRTVT